MATTTKSTVEDLSTEEKISVLYGLQQIDSKMDSINHIKGELPYEVQDLEDIIGGLETRISGYGAQADELAKEVKAKKEEIEQAKTLIKKYEAQQDDVTQQPRIRLPLQRDRIPEARNRTGRKSGSRSSTPKSRTEKQIEDTKELLEDRKVDLEAKRAELAGIEADTAKELEDLQAQAENARAKIDERLLSAYDRIRRNVRNGLAVVTVKRDACGGCSTGFRRSDSSTSG